MIYELVQKARVLHNVKLERLTRDNHSSLLGSFLSYEENEVLWIQTLGTYSKHLIFFVIYKSIQKARVLNTIKLERLDNDKHYCLLGLF